MKTQFTPGPWNIGHKNTVYADNMPIAVVATDGITASRGHNQLANATLLAAAPDLFEALENLLDWAEHAAGCSSNDECFGCYDDEELISARTALQKAKGGK